MKHWIHLPAAAVIAALVGFGSTYLSSPARGAAAARGTDDELTRLRERLAELERQQGELEQALAEAPSAVPLAPAREPALDLDRAVADYMARRATRAEEVARGGSPDGPDLEARALADRILLGEVSGIELEQLWQRLREEKRIDAVLAEIERRAASAPNNPDLAAELGKAYIQKLFDAGVGPLAGMWGEKADKAFDRALELDPEHQEARFEKAIALSNWPAFLGKQGEAARQLELLREQQERSPAEARHARTYFFLGNLYEQMGERDKAAAAWARGLELFPDDEALRARRKP